MNEKYDLRALSREIHDFDPEGSVRLLSLADAVDEVGEPTGWAGSDVFNSVGIPAILSRFDQMNGESASGWKGDRLRAGLALLPIAITWLGLWHATGAYAKAVTKNPSLADTPFLLLWQKGFDGNGGGILGWMSFGKVAFLDALVIGVLIVSSWRAHTARHSHFQSVSARRLELETWVQQAVWNASLELARRSSERAYFEQFRAVSEQMLEQLAVERERIGRLADERDRSVADLTSVADGFKIGAFEFARNAMKLAEVTDTNTSVAGSLEKTVADLATAIHRISHTVEITSEQLDKSSLTMVEIVRHVRATTDLMADNSDAASTQIVELGRVTERLDSQVQDVTSALHGGRASYEKAVDQLIASGTLIETTAQKLDDALRVFESSIAGSEELNSRVTTLATELHEQIEQQKAAAQILTKSNKSLEKSAKLVAESGDKFVDDAAEVTTGLSESARTLAAVADALSESSSEIADGLLALVNEIATRLEVADGRHQASISAVVSALSAIKAIEIELVDAGNEVRKMGKDGMEKLDSSAANVRAATGTLNQLMQQLEKSETAIMDLLKRGL